MSNQAQNHHSHDMTNSHLLLQTFDYYEPATLEEAITLLTNHGPRARVMAGGTNLIVWMKMEQVTPEVIINIHKLPGLTGIKGEDNLEIGTLTKIWELRNSRVLQCGYAALAEAGASFGSTQIQLMGTIGGNICNGSPASDTVPALLVLGAELSIVGPNGERAAPLESFLVGPGEVALQDGEMLTAVRIPAPEPSAGSAYIKLSRVRADLAKASAAASIVRSEDTIIECRLAFGSVGPTALRCREAERMLIGKTFSSELALAAGRVASRTVAPIDDVRSTAWYRREVVQALAHDAVKRAWDRAGLSRGQPVSGEWRHRHNSSATQRWELAELKQRTHSTRAVSRDTQRQISLTVNGVHHCLSVRPNELLLNVLRERLDLTGTKYGCGIGECGACTVHVDGVPTLACLTLAVAAAGREVTTVEGLEDQDGELDPIQEAFIEQSAFQCGYCTPGMLMMTKRLLEELPSPSEDDIRDYLKGNRCRCTGFAAIVRAVESCAAAK
jgi:carbon-monoxide dehydrogenase medium subunit